MSAPPIFRLPLPHSLPVSLSPSLPPSVYTSSFSSSSLEHPRCWCCYKYPLVVLTAEQQEGQREEQRTREKDGTEWWDGIWRRGMRRWAQREWKYVFGWPVPDFLFQHKLGVDMLTVTTGAALVWVSRQWSFPSLSLFVLRTLQPGPSFNPTRTADGLGPSGHVVWCESGQGWDVMLLCCWWCLRPEAVELDSRRVEHHCVLNCEATNSSAIAVVSLDSWENGTTSTTLHPSQRSAECCS